MIVSTLDVEFKYQTRGSKDGSNIKKMIKRKQQQQDKTLTRNHEKLT